MKSFDVLCLKCLETFTLTLPYAVFPLCCLKCRQEIIFDDGFYTENAVVDKGFYIANKIIKDTLSLINKSNPDLIFLFTNQSIEEQKVSNDLIRYIYWDLEGNISERFGKESLMWGELVHAAVFVIKASLKKRLNYEQLKLNRPRVLKEILEQKIKHIVEMSDADRDFDIDMECLTFELLAIQELLTELQSSSLKESEPNLRQKVLLFLANSYGQLELPLDLRPINVARSIHRDIGGDFDNLRKMLSNPTKCKKESKKSKLSLITDLKFVQTIIEEKTSLECRAIISEISFLIGDLEDERK